MVMIQVVRMSKVPRVLGLGFQCTMSVPLPNKSELIFDCDGPRLQLRSFLREIICIRGMSGYNCTENNGTDDSHSPKCQP